MVVRAIPEGSSVVLVAMVVGLGFAVGCGSNASTSGTGGQSAGGGGTTGMGGTPASGGMADARTMGEGGMSDSSARGGSMATGGGSDWNSGGTAGIREGSGGSVGVGGTLSRAGAGGQSMGDGGTAGGSGMGGTGGASNGKFSLTSQDQAEGAKFGTAYTCAANNGAFGSGVNPELNWTGVPPGTKSFAMTFIDTKLGESSAMGQHWAIWDVPATVTQFPKGTTGLTGPLADAKQTNRYLAPCPSGNDTYAFTLYALSEANLAVTGAEGTGSSNSAGVAKVLAALKMVTPLGAATLTGTSGPQGK